MGESSAGLKPWDSWVAWQRRLQLPALRGAEAPLFHGLTVLEFPS